MGPGWWTPKRALLVLAALAIVSLLAVLKFSTPRTVRVRWDYDYAQDPPCTSPAADNCVSGFRVFVGDPTNRSQQLFVANRFDAGHHMMSEGLEATFKVNRFGYLQFCVVAVRKGQIGVTVESPPLCSRRLVLPFGIARDQTK